MKFGKRFKVVLPNGKLGINVLNAKQENVEENL